MASDTNQRHNHQGLITMPETISRTMPPEDIREGDLIWESRTPVLEVKHEKGITRIKTEDRQNFFRLDHPALVTREVPTDEEQARIELDKWINRAHREISKANDALSDMYKRMDTYRYRIEGGTHIFGDAIIAQAPATAWEEVTVYLMGGSRAAVFNRIGPKTYPEILWGWLGASIRDRGQRQTLTLLEDAIEEVSMAIFRSMLEKDSTSSDPMRNEAQRLRINALRDWVQQHTYRYDRFLKKDGRVAELLYGDRVFIRL
jgi:hypothetical protein